MSYHCPTDLSAALQIAAKQGGQIVAGGTDVYPASKPGITAQHYLDVTRIAGLSEISHGPDGTRIGAAATWTDILRADLPPAFDGLKLSAREVGSVQIQNAGTIAGNLCNASPAADGVPPLLTLNASVELASQARGQRVLPLDAFITGARQTVLAPDELVTAILIPAQPAGAGSAFEKLGSRKYLVISITMTAAVIVCDLDGRIAQARVAVGACAPVAVRLGALERAVIGQRPGDVVIAPQHLEGLAPIDDVRGSGTFRLDVVGEQCARAIKKAARA